MEEKKELRELLERMDKSNRQQATFAKLQCLFSLIAAICCIVVLVVICSLMPQLENMMGQVDVVLTNVEDVSRELAEADIEGVMNNLEQVTEELAEADLGSMAGEVSELMSASQTGVEEALNKLNGIDLETLNTAIKDLAAVVEPLAHFFDRFG